MEEEQEYLARSLKAATNSCADLVPCPLANCDGVAVSGGGAFLALELVMYISFLLFMASELFLAAYP